MEDGVEKKEKEEEEEEKVKEGTVGGGGLVEDGHRRLLDSGFMFEVMVGLVILGFGRFELEVVWHAEVNGTTQDSDAHIGSRTGREGGGARLWVDGDRLVGVHVESMLWALGLDKALG